MRPLTKKPLILKLTPNVTHVAEFPDLEDQMCTFTPESGESPDRLDALVWAITHLFGNTTIGEFSLVA